MTRPTKSKIESIKPDQQDFDSVEKEYGPLPIWSHRGMTEAAATCSLSSDVTPFIFSPNYYRGIIDLGRPARTSTLTFTCWFAGAKSEDRRRRGESDRDEASERLSGATSG